MPSTLISLAYATDVPLPDGVDVMRRSSDWGSSRWGKLRLAVVDSVRVARRARGYDQLVVMTAGIELFLLAVLVRRPHLLAVDWLLPRSARLDRSRVLRRVARFVVVRRTDLETLPRRFGVDPARIVFVPFPAPRPRPAPAARTEDADGYFYAAGWAHRDWATLRDAVSLHPVDLVLAADPGFPMPASVDVRGPLSPDEGRGVMRSARCVVLPLVDTELPSGPLVLLDAMAHGKPVIVSDVGGSRDYVTPGVDAVVVPAGDAWALADAMARVDADPDLRASLAEEAARTAATFTGQRFWRGVLGRDVVVPDQ